jgi:nucleolin
MASIFGLYRWRCTNDFVDTYTAPFLDNLAWNASEDDNKATFAEYGKVYNGEEENSSVVKQAKGENGEATPAAAAPAEADATYTAFVGGLSFNADEDAVREFFGACGEIASVRLPIHRDTGKPKGIAYVEFTSKDGLDAAVALDGGSMMDRYLAIKVSESTGSKPAFGGARNTAPLSAKPEGCKTVFVGNLAWNASEDDIKAAFAECGNVWNVRLAMDRETGKPKGFAHVEFEDEAGPEAAVKLTGTQIAGRAILVDYAGSSIGGGGSFGGGRAVDYAGSSNGAPPTKSSPTLANDGVVWLCRIGRGLDRQLFVLRRWSAGPVCGEYVCSTPVRFIEKNISLLVNHSNNYNVVLKRSAQGHINGLLNDNDVIASLQHVHPRAIGGTSAVCSCQRPSIARFPSSLHVPIWHHHLPSCLLPLPA